MAIRLTKGQKINGIDYPNGIAIIGLDAVVEAAASQGGGAVPVNLAVVDLTTVSGAVKGLVGSDRPSLVFVRDHPYRQIVGNTGYASQHQWFKDHGLYPYSLTVCTQLGTSAAVGTQGFGAGNLYWPEVKALEDDGVEITNHANRHVYSLARTCTGITASYGGANATATVYVTDAPRTLVMSAGANSASFDLTNAAYDTVTELLAAMNAVTGWYCTMADELDGTERSADMLVLASPGRNAKNTVVYLPLNGGLVIRYTGTAYKTAMVKCLLGTYLQCFGDGVLVGEFQFAIAAYDTLAELAAAVRALDGGGVWDCEVIDNRFRELGIGPAYCNGTEATGGNLLQGDWQDCFQRYVWIDAGMPIAQVWRKQLKRCRDVAAANGVTMRNFSDVGGGAWPQIMAQIGEFSNLSRCSNVAATISPSAVPAHMAYCLPNTGFDSGLATAAQMAAVIPALVDSPGFVCSMFIHQTINDGSSGRNFVDGYTGGGDGYVAEATMQAYLNQVKIATDARQLNVLTQQGMYAVRGSLAKPKNRIFNPKFKNSGNAGAEALTGLNVGDGGRRVPGWIFRTPNINTVDITDGVVTVTTTGVTVGVNYLQAQVWLEPGKTYHVGAVAETVAFVNGSNGVTLELRPSAGWEYLSEVSATNPGSEGVYWTEQAGRAAGVHKSINAALTVPVPTRKRAYIRGRTGGTFNLSVNKNIRLNIDSIGTTADIDCSAGAVSAAAVYAWEIAAAINAAIKATAAYAGKSEYFNLARAENGRLVLESPYPSGSNPLQGRISVLAGTAASAATAIFGTSGGSEQPWGIPFTNGSQGLQPHVLTIYFDGQGTYRISAPVVREIEGQF